MPPRAWEQATRGAGGGGGVDVYRQPHLEPLLTTGVRLQLGEVTLQRWEAGPRSHALITAGAGRENSRRRPHM